MHFQVHWLDPATQQQDTTGADYPQGSALAQKWLLIVPQLFRTQLGDYIQVDTLKYVDRHRVIKLKTQVSVNKISLRGVFLYTKPGTEQLSRFPQSLTKN